MSYLIGLIVMLLGGFLYQKKRADNSQALETNLETKNQLKNEDKTIAKDQGLLEAEEEKRKAIEATKDSLKDLADFFDKK